MYKKYCSITGEAGVAGALWLFSTCRRALRIVADRTAHLAAASVKHELNTLNLN